MLNLMFDLDGTLVESHLDFAAIRRDTGFPEGVGLLEHLETLEDAAAICRAEDIIHRHELSGQPNKLYMPLKQVNIWDLMQQRHFLEHSSGKRSIHGHKNHKVSSQPRLLN